MIYLESMLVHVIEDFRIIEWLRRYFRWRRLRHHDRIRYWNWTERRWCFWIHLNCLHIITFLIDTWQATFKTEYYKKCVDLIVVAGCKEVIYIQGKRFGLVRQN